MSRVVLVTYSLPVYVLVDLDAQTIEAVRYGPEDELSDIETVQYLAANERWIGDGAADDADVVAARAVIEEADAWPQWDRF